MYIDNGVYDRTMGSGAFAAHLTCAECVKFFVGFGHPVWRPKS